MAMVCTVHRPSVPGPWLAPIPLPSANMIEFLPPGQQANDKVWIAGTKGFFVDELSEF